MHVRSHTDLPGPVAEGNRIADSLATPVSMAQLPDLFQQAKLSHQMFHQNVPGLVRQFHLRRDQARAIVATCPHCQTTAMPSLGSGVNPRGLGSCEVWQMDVTHIPEFESHPKMTAASLTLNIALLVLLVAQAAAWIVPQPKQNVWVMLVKSLQRDELCLSTGAAGNPMTTCLVGIPLKPEEYPESLMELVKEANKGRPAQRVVRSLPSYKVKKPVQNPLLLWRDWQAYLERAVAEPQEFDLLNSSLAPFCVQFRYYPDNPSLYPKMIQDNKKFQAAAWCKNIAHVKMPSTLDSRPLKLPKGMFLICGDRAWAGIPSRLLGGPCTLGQLSLFSPNATQIENWTPKNNSAIKKRSLENLDPDCDSEIFHWSKPKRVAVSVFLPWLAAAQALGELGQFECWVVKQANLTSTALGDLLEDEEITRRATLQN
ncbi:uncharacterized protein LOC131590705 [Poecile atricapillus]|uniref:uncharacterized protein LOC131590705 n=1 Tax=Poecile atricapillus TaxID=48891 RepID=UPI002739B871|nr:uncharacterized protein LOC131590705 [Poecile atricapillus]